MTDTSTRQLKLGAILEGVGMDHNGWRDPETPGDASVNIDWYIQNARLAEAASLSWRQASSRRPFPALSGRLQRLIIQYQLASYDGLQGPWVGITARKPDKKASSAS